MKKVAFFICLFVLLPLTINSQTTKLRRQVGAIEGESLSIPGRFLGMVFTPAGQLLTISNVKVYDKGPIACMFWNLSNREVVRSFELPPFSTELGGFHPTLSEDGQFLAVQKDHEEGEQAKLWDLSTGRHIATHPSTHDFRLWHFSPDGKFLAKSDGRSLGALDTRSFDSWDPFFTRDPNKKFRTEFVAFSPDGKFLAFAMHTSDLEESTRRDAILEIQVWDPHTRKRICAVVPSFDECDRIFIRDLVFSPDGRNFAVVLVGHNSVIKSQFSTTSISENPGVIKTIQLWDLSGKLRHRLKLPIGHNAHTIAFSPDGRMIAAPITDKRELALTTTVQLLDTDTGKLIRTLSPPSVYVQSVVFSPDGQRIVSSSVSSAIGDQVPLWNPHTGKLIALLDNGYSRFETNLGISDVIFSPDGRFIAGTYGESPNKRPIVWEIDPGR